MEDSWLLFSFIYAAPIAFIIISKLFTQKHLPPGPKPWPIIGNLLQIGSIPHQSFHSLSQKYGEIMLLSFGKSPVVIVSSPEMAKQLLRTHDASFASRPIIAAGYHLCSNHSFVALAPFGPYWRQTRRIYLSHVLSPKGLEPFDQIVAEERRRFVSRLCSSSPVVIRNYLCRYTLSITSRMFLGDECFGSVKIDELKTMVDEWFLLAGEFNVGDWMPWLSFLDVQGHVKRMKALSKKFDGFYDQVIGDHLARRGCKDNDVVDTLLQISEDPGNEVKITIDSVKGLVQNLLLGGTDTSAAAVEWAIHEILRQPRILQKAKEELQRVIGRNRWVEEKDFHELPYIDAIINETFRLHPPSTLIPRSAIHDCNVAGYDVAKGTTVLVNAWSIGRDPNSWDAPLQFQPERFIGKDIDMTGGNFAMLPFGSGRRGCPGYRLGVKMVRIALANLIHGFELKLVPGMNPQDICMEEVYGLITHPKHPLSIIVEPTLPPHLY